MKLEKYSNNEEKPTKNTHLEAHKQETINYLKKLLSEKTYASLNGKISKSKKAMLLLEALKDSELGIKQYSLIYNVIK